MYMGNYFVLKIKEDINVFVKWLDLLLSIANGIEMNWIGFKVPLNS